MRSWKRRTTVPYRTRNFKAHTSNQLQHFTARRQWTASCAKDSVLAELVFRYTMKPRRAKRVLNDYVFIRGEIRKWRAHADVWLVCHKPHPHCWAHSRATQQCTHSPSIIDRIAVVNYADVHRCLSVIDATGLIHELWDVSILQLCLPYRHYTVLVV